MREAASGKRHDGNPPRSAPCSPSTPHVRLHKSHVLWARGQQSHENPLVSSVCWYSTMEVAQKTQCMLNHVLKCLSAHRVRFQTNPNPTSILDTPKTRVRPLFVGIQGPQGSGKSFLTSHLHQKLSSPPHSLSVVVLSIDDLYLPHVQLVALANANPENKLLRGRGYRVLLVLKGRLSPSPITIAGQSATSYTFITIQHLHPL